MLGGARGLDPPEVGGQKAASLVRVLQPQRQHVDVLHALRELGLRPALVVVARRQGDIVQQLPMQFTRLVRVALGEF